MRGWEKGCYNAPVTVPQPPTTPPVWVNRPGNLEAMARDLMSQPQVAVDTESNSLFAYHEQVCLIQFSTPQTDYLLDSLALHNLQCLQPLFASPAIEKIFHAAEYDLICLRRDFGFQFANLFDTMIAARILGREAVGLGSMLEQEFDLHLDKRYQRANWGERPLKPAMLAYARLDSHYLVALRQNMQTALEQAGRWELAQEDFKRLCTAPAPQENHNPFFWRVAGGKELTPRQAAVLESLCQYREDCARRANVPPFKVIGNDSLLTLALASPTDLSGLDEADALSFRQREKHAAGLLQAIQRGMTAKPLRRPSIPRQDERYLLRLDALRTWRKDKGKEWGVESDVILPRDVMEALAQAAPTTPQALAEVMADLPWRVHHFGAEILGKLNRKGHA